MDHPDFPPAIWFACIAWVVTVGTVSALVRWRRGKPIRPRVPADALFAQRDASARFASKCLLVWITPDQLCVVPKFPFNLGFLPDIYGLEHAIALGRIQDVGLRESLMGNNVIVRYDGGAKRLGLRLNNPHGFFAVLRDRGVRAG